ncbi:adenosylcobinamide-phosphate synthase CbiB [uncultured Cohaesibacter sp.]|uniref:adenosylcobinamide-phosphate synthase CbiB n=1 Tax=uncultured Cohaesibacter sp. TaxID=1002546 RepID=UPI0029C797D2|nr:adenosylcobinamide-phosphate synthase CbiB [uncultured Cohaesibacter sp.]
MILFGGLFAVTVLMAVILDAIFGEPDWLWRRLPHPVVLFGKAISVLEKWLNRPAVQSALTGRLAGTLSVAILLLFGAAGGYFLQLWLMSFGFVGWLIVALLASSLIAQRSLYEHVQHVAEPLARFDLEGGRQAVSMIVGRDTRKLDEAGVARAAIESLAENYSDGIVAPLFWLVFLGLPGIICYKIVNTADSMIGHRNERYLYFGWAAARLDDLLNLVPARLTMILLLFSPVSLYAPDGHARQSWRSFLADARRHRSPNAGWPEGAMARRLNIALSGPRYYEGELVDEPFVNDGGKRALGANDIQMALRLYLRACQIQFLVVSVLAAVALI